MRKYLIVSTSRFCNVLLIVLFSSSFILQMELSIFTDDSNCKNSVIKKDNTKSIGSGEYIMNHPVIKVDDKDNNFSSSFNKLNLPVKKENDFVKIVSETLVDHDPISIDGNNDFINQATVGGWLGNGSEVSPYIINGLNITGSSIALIEIKNSDLYFKITTCIINNGVETGIRFINVTNGEISHSNLSNNGRYGIVLTNSKWITISNNGIINNSDFAIIVSSSEFLTIQYNIARNGTYGVYLSSSDSNILFNNTFYFSQFGIAFGNSKNNTIYNNLVHETDFGIQVSSSDNNQIFNNILYSNYWGIYLRTSKFCNISWNTVSNNEYGLWLCDYSINNSISTNTIFRNNNNGVYLVYSENNTLIDNTIYDNQQSGIYLTYSSWYNKIINNTIDNNSNGIYCYDSGNNTILRNQIINNSGSGIALSWCGNDHISENTILNSGSRGMNIQSENCSLINNFIDFSYESGIHIFYSSNSKIVNNSVFNSGHTGILLELSENFNITNNTIVSSGYDGINIYSSNGIILYNLFESSVHDGLALVSSFNIIVKQNNFSSNVGYGFRLWSSINITVSWNNLIENNPTGTSQAYDGDNSTLINSVCFNYWDDCISPDNNADSIVDVPYNIEGFANNQDPYPLVNSVEFPTHLLLKPSILYPNGGEILSGIITIEWKESVDSFGQDITYAIYYSSNDGVSWILIVEDLTTTTLNWETTTVNDGSDYLIKLIAKNSIGLTAEMILVNSFIIDNNAPNIGLSYITNNSIISDNTICFSIIDVTLTSVWFNWDTTPNQTVSEPWEIFVPVEEGEHWLTIFANDSLGHLAVIQYKFLVIYAPDIELLSPVNGSIVSSETSCDIRFTDPYGGLHWIWYNWDNQSNITIDNLGYLEFTEFGGISWPLPETEGWHTLIVYANDTYGFINQLIIKLYIDTTTPFIELIELQNNSILTSDDNVMLSIIDSSLEEVWFNWDGFGNQSLFSPYQVNVPCDEGYHWLTMYANDSVGHLSVKKYRWWINLVPSINLVSPTNNTIQIDGTVIVLNFEDNNLDNVWYNWDNDANQSFITPWNIVLSHSDGWHWLNVYANDTAGALTVNCYYFYCDADSPVILLMTPENDSIITSETFISLNITDFSQISVWYQWDNANNQSLSDPWQVTPPFTSGFHWLTVYAEDSVGHLTVATYLFTINVAPKIILNSPLNGSIVTAGMNCSSIFTDETGGLHWIWYNWDNQSEVILDNLAYSSLAEFTYFWFVPETEGWHYLTINVNDTYGLVNTVLLKVYIDVTPPIFTLHNPDNDTSIETSVVIELAVIDFSLDNVWYNWDDGMNQTLTSPYQIDVPTEEGYHWLTVYANDSVGHLSVKKYCWWINQAPSIGLISPGNNTIQKDGTVIILNVEDNNLDDVWYNWDNGVNQSFIIPWNVTLSLSDGWHWLNVYAIDTADALTNIRYYFYCDTDSPSILLMYPENDSIITSATTIHLNITDFSLVSAWYQWNNGNNQSLSDPWQVISPSITGIHWLTVYAEDSVGHVTVQKYRWSIVFPTTTTTSTTSNISIPSTSTSKSIPVFTHGFNVLPFLMGIMFIITVLRRTRR